MTDTTMDLQSLLEKTTDSDFLRQMIGFTAQRLMALEVETLTGAEPGARSPERINQRYCATIWMRNALPRLKCSPVQTRCLI